MKQSSSVNTSQGIRLTSIDSILDRIERPNEPLLNSLPLLSLKDKNIELEKRICELQSELEDLRSRLKLQQNGVAVSLSDISLDSLINQVVDKTKNKGKLGFFKKMLADNKEIRK